MKNIIRNMLKDGMTEEDIVSCLSEGDERVSDKSRFQFPPKHEDLINPTNIKPKQLRKTDDGKGKLRKT